MKQRLVGAIVLGCLAIIFLPILLDGEGVSSPDMNIVIPNAPEFLEPMEIEPQRPVVLSDTDEILITTEEPSATEGSVEVVDAVAVSGNEDSQVASEELPTLGSEGLPQAWSVRLGLFSEEANASALIGELLSQGYRAYSESMPTTQGDLTAVFVGPVIVRSEAETLRAELSNAFNIEALVVDFGVNQDN